MKRLFGVANLKVFRGSGFPFLENKSLSGVSDFGRILIKIPPSSRYLK